MNPYEFTLVTVIRVYPGQLLDKSTIQDYISESLRRDDVFQSSFLDNILFYGSTKEELTIGDGVDDLLRQWKTKTIDFVHDLDPSEKPLSPGPYVTLVNSLWQPWRLHNDRQNAFMSSFEPTAIVGGK